MTAYSLPLTPAEYSEIRRWLGCPGHDGKRVLGEGLTGEGMIALRRKVEALEHGGLGVPGV